MPILGLMSDSDSFSLNQLHFVLGLFPVVFFVLILLYKFFSKFSKATLPFIFSVINYGSFFKIRKKIQQPKYVDLNSFNSSWKKRLSSVRYLTVFSFVPYYLTWPLIIILLDNYPENRGSIMGLSSVVNGLTTLSLTLIIDPFVVKLSRHQILSVLFFRDQILMRSFSALVAFGMILFLLVFF